MSSASSAFRNLEKEGKQAASNTKRAFADLKTSMGEAVEGMRTVGMATLPMAIGMGVGVAKAAAFEKQMSGVRSIMRGATAEEFKMLNDEARRLGIVSVFSAQQAGEAMENLAVLGFKPLEVMQAIGPTLDAAAVAGIGLGEAAQYVGGSTRAMGLAISETARVADVLTVAGQKSATTLPLMAEALKLSAPAAVQAGIGLEETVSVLGKLADAQLQGTMGATAFVNMMNKLAGPTKEAAKMLKDMNVKLTDSAGKFRPLVDIIMDVKAGLDQETDAAVRLGMAQEIFGIRGARAYSALSLAGSKATKELQTQLENSMGAAQQAAETRLDNILGAFTLFGASLEGVAIELFTPFLEAGKNMVKDMTNSLNNLLLTMGDLKKPLQDGQTEFDRLREVAEKVGWDVIPVAQGINDALETMVGLFKDATEAVKSFGLASQDAFSPDATRDFTKYVTIAGFLSAILGPLMLGMAGLIWVMKGMGKLLAPFAFIGKLFKGWPGLLSRAALWAGVLKKALFTPMTLSALTGGVKALGGAFLTLGVNIKMAYLAGVALLNKGLIALAGLITPLMVALAIPLAIFIGILHATTIEGETMVESFSKNFEVGIKMIGEFFMDFYEAILNFVIDPLSTMARGIANVMKLIGMDVPKGLEAFGQAQEKAGKTVKFERGPTQIAGAGQTGRYVEFVPGGVAGAGSKGWRPAAPAKRKPGEYPEVMKQMEAQMGTAEMSAVFDKWMADQKATMASAEKAAKSAEQAAKSKRDVSVKVDGREVARASAKHQEEVEARSGAQATPWQRTGPAIHGVNPGRR